MFAASFQMVAQFRMESPGEKTVIFVPVRSVNSHHNSSPLNQGSKEIRQWPINYYIPFDYTQNFPF